MSPAVLILLGIVVLGGLAIVAERRQKRRTRLLRELQKADGAVQREYGAARRAMNDAAGQSWRNRFE